VFGRIVLAAGSARARARICKEPAAARRAPELSWTAVAAANNDRPTEGKRRGRRRRRPVYAPTHTLRTLAARSVYDV